jgi:flagellar basal-body rod protein FlgG
MSIRLKNDERPPTNEAMDVGLNIAASGMLAEQVRQDQLSNDLANASTPGYKPDEALQQSFGAMLLTNTSTGKPVGSIDMGVRITKIVTVMTGAPLQNTGQPLNFAIVGTGFFAVKTPNGIRYTRDGQFSSDSSGNLVDSQGNEVLDQNGQPIPVGAKGTVPANALGVFDVPNAAKQGDNLFTGTAAGKGTGQVESGVLEGSGVDPVRTMVEMISSLRAYEAGQKAIQTIDETMQQASTQVGSLK